MRRRRAEAYDAAERYAARQVRKHRLAKRWTQENLAAAMVLEGFDWTQSTVSRIEAGKRGLTLKEARVIVDVLDIQRGLFWQRTAHLAVPPRRRRQGGTG